MAVPREVHGAAPHGPSTGEMKPATEIKGDLRPTRKTVSPALCFALALTFSACGGGDDSSPTSEEAGGDKTAAAPQCTTKATKTCTPHVGSRETVRVGGLSWRVLSATTAHTIGDPGLGVAETANGEYVVLELRVRSGREGNTTLLDAVELEVDGKTYGSDTDGTVAAAVYSDNEAFDLETLRPRATATLLGVFDVPARALRSKIEARFNEPGDGSIRGYIRLPRRLGQYQSG
jgi:hypothetical protein